jgi:PAS domain S-box-containing protein
MWHWSRRIQKRAYMPMRKSPDTFNDLRKQAEKLLAEGSEKVTRISHQKDIQKMSHELSVYHIEIEMQNDELRRAQEQLEESRERYVDLYEHAPVGYLTFDEKGLVLDMNLTATQLLAIDRTSLLRKPFTLLIASESQDTFYLHRREVLRTPGTHACELMLRRSNGGEQFFHAQLASTAVQAKGAPAMRTVLTDLTGHLAFELAATRRLQEISTLLISVPYGEKTPRL